ncbi:hypothetical protein BHE74_00020726 [Ensete ventricosum]|nr:hypothetical protein BHE74_00020726 [Ensete ventricosum]
MRTQRYTTVLFQISLLRLRRLDSNRRVELGGRSGNPIGQKKAGDGVRWRTPWETPNLPEQWQHFTSIDDCSKLHTRVPSSSLHGGWGCGRGEAPGKAHRKECEEAIISPAALFLQPRKSFPGRALYPAEMVVAAAFSTVRGRRASVAGGGGRFRTVIHVTMGWGPDSVRPIQRTEFKTI